MVRHDPGEEPAARIVCEMVDKLRVPGWCNLNALWPGDAIHDKDVRADFHRAMSEKPGAPASASSV